MKRQLQFIENFYMSRCLDLARQGIPAVKSNPRVGACIVYKDRIIGEGFHERFGDPHAEINAINSIATSDKHLISSSSLFVNLEPCSHFGKTPPCAEEIIRQQFQKVIIGMLDPNPRVNGKGCKILRQSGIDVKVGILEEECQELNKAFIINQKLGRPYIILKWAQSEDGYIGRSGESIKLSGRAIDIHMHKLRAEMDAILVGAGTVISDNPALTVRHVEGKNPLRIVLKGKREIPAGSKLLNEGAESWIFGKTLGSTKYSNARSVLLQDQEDLIHIMKRLYELNVGSILVEGGRIILEAFLQADLWDELLIIQTDKTLKSGIKAPKPPNVSFDSIQVENDTLLHFSRKTIPLL
jgi:diaminohydroxyphosphoribosylaminopyrimidine deaminase/5-amino-6-(5-phosphoribosylamino)uracil reductase